MESIKYIKRTVAHCDRPDSSGAASKWYEHAKKSSHAGELGRATDLIRVDVITEY